MIDPRKVKVGDKFISSTSKVKVEVVNIIDGFIFVKELISGNDDVYNIPSSNFDGWFKYGRK